MHAGAAPDERRSSTPAGGAILRKSVEELGIDVHTRHAHHRDPRATDKVDAASGFADGPTLDVRHGGRRRRHPAERRPRPSRSGLDRRARRSSSTTRCASIDDPDVYAVGECVQHRGEVYGLVAPLWEQAVVLADHLTGAEPGRRLPRLADRDQAEGRRRRRRRRWASQGPERDDDELVVFSEPKRGVYKSLVIRDDKLVGATLLGDSQQGRLPDQAFDRGLPLPEERVELLFDLGDAAEPRSASPSWPTTRRSATATASPRAPSGRVRRRRRARRVAGVMDATRAGKGCGSCKALVAQIVEWAAGGAVERGPVRALVRAGHPDGQAGADGRRSASRTCSRCPRCSPRSPRTAPRTRSRRWGWRRC